MRLHTTTGHVRLACGDVMDWREVIEPGTVKLSHVDGPYDMRKADWDCLTGARVGFPDRLATLAQCYPDIPAERIDALGGYIAALTVLDPRGADLAAWYAPILAEVSAACALSASCYLWNTDAGEALLRPVMQALGWTWRGCVTWDKGVAAMAGKVDTDGLRSWYDVTEACGFYQRESESPFPDLLVNRREVAALSRKDLAELFPSRTGGLTGCVLNWEQGYNVPTREQWEAMMARLHETGRLTMPTRNGTEYDHLRAEYEASRPPFTAPLGVSNVWRANAVPGRQRLKRSDGETHPCQKPLDFAERILRASSRPGDLVVDWFAGTSRLAVANVQRLDRAERRDVVSIEADARWLDAVAPALSAEASLASLGTEDAPSLFGAAL